MMAPILEAEELVKNYGSLQALRGISFTVEAGEIFGLLGPNGAGKTTAISILTGVTPPTSGTARICGLDIFKNALEVKRKTGLVPQDLALYPTLSARANLNFFGSIYGLRGTELKDRVEDVLAVVSLTERANEPIEKYSGGMKRRINIAAGLVHQPDLLFLDEPTVGVDPQSRNHIFESVLKLNRERGMSIIYTSHYMEEVELLCKRVAIVDQGRIIALDTVKNLVAMLGGGIIQVGLRRWDNELIGSISNLPAVRCTTLVPLPGDSSAAPAAFQTPSNTVSRVVKIEAEDSHQAVVNVIEFLNKRDIQISSLDILEPNLESVFLHLTGKKLRE
jgi:ABC-2 type transport system ATP-binding protein